MFIRYRTRVYCFYYILCVFIFICTFYVKNSAYIISFFLVRLKWCDYIKNAKRISSDVPILLFRLPRIFQTHIFYPKRLSKFQFSSKWNMFDVCMIFMQKGCKKVLACQFCHITWLSSRTSHAWILFYRLFVANVYSSLMYTTYAKKIENCVGFMLSINKERDRS